MGDLSDHRKTYNKSELLETSIPDNPFDLFDIWFQDAEKKHAQRQGVCLLRGWPQEDGAEHSGAGPLRFGRLLWLLPQQ